ncbi:MAG TPA: hypothetical protein VFX50_13610, partial [Gemmatimonadales bacterium]|nr:hypothetical protein [Gemmatimonadales bacterium]
VVTTYHGPLLGTGAALFGFHWILSAVLAQTDFRIGEDTRTRDPSRNNPLSAPLVGPFIALGTEEGRPPEERAVLALDGIAQVGSLCMAMAGLVLEQQWLVRVTAGGAVLSLAF